MPLEDLLPIFTSITMIVTIASAMSILYRFFQKRLLTSKKAEMELKERILKLTEELEKTKMFIEKPLSSIDVYMRMKKPKKFVKGKLTVGDLAKRVGEIEESIAPLLKLTDENPNFSSIEHAFLKDSIDRFREDVKDMKDDLRREIDAIKDTTKTWFTILTIIIGIVGFITLLVPYLFKLLLG